MLDVLGAETGGETAEFAGDLQSAGDVAKGEFFGRGGEEAIERALRGAQQFFGGLPFGILKEERALQAQLGLVAAGIGLDSKTGAEEFGVVGADTATPVVTAALRNPLPSHHYLIFTLANLRPRYSTPFGHWPPIINLPPLG